MTEENDQNDDRIYDSSQGLSIKYKTKKLKYYVFEN